jgi:hypothetical protein
MHHVYHLLDPRDRVVRYIGKTASPKARLAAHLKDAQQSQNTLKKRWISELLAQGLQPVMVIAATVADDLTARVIESQHCRQHLATIYNIHDPAKGAKDLKKPGATPA